MKLLLNKNLKKNNIRLLLTEFKHIKYLLEYSSNKKFYKFLEYKTFNNKTAKKYFEKKINDKKNFFFTIFLKKKIIGTLSLHKINLKKKTCNIGYGLNPKYWGKNLFSYTIKLLIKILKFNKFKQVIAYTRYDNISSIAGLIKNNFKIIEIKKNYYFDRKTKKNYDAFVLKLKI